jgi:hypothetical protein
VRDCKRELLPATRKVVEGSFDTITTAVLFLHLDDLCKALDRMETEPNVTREALITLYKCSQYMHACSVKPTGGYRAYDNAVHITAAFERLEEHNS